MKKGFILLVCALGLLPFSRQQISAKTLTVTSVSMPATAAGTPDEGSFFDILSKAEDGDVIEFDNSILGDTILLRAWYAAPTTKSVVINGNGITFGTASTNNNLVYSVDFRSPVELNDINFTGVRINIQSISSVVRRCTFKDAYDTALYIMASSTSDVTEASVRVENCRFNNVKPNQTNQGAVYAMPGSKVNTLILDVVSCSFVDNVAKSGTEGKWGVALGANNTKIELRLFNNVFQNNTYSSAKKMMSVYAENVKSFGYNVIDGEVNTAIETALTTTDKLAADMSEIVAWDDIVGEYIVVKGGSAYQNFPANTSIADLELPETDILGNTINYSKPTHSGACQLPLVPDTWVVTSKQVPGGQQPLEEGSLFYVLEEAKDGDMIEFSEALSGDTIDLGDVTLSLTNIKLTFKGNGIVLKGGNYSFEEGCYTFSDITFSAPRSIGILNADWLADHCVFKNFYNEYIWSMIKVVNDETASRKDYVVNFTACSFINNIAKYAGVMYVDNKTSTAGGTTPPEQITTFSFISCSFLGNSGYSIANKAVTLYFQSQPKVLIGNCAFERSRAYAGGGAITGGFISLGYNVFEGGTSGINQITLDTDKKEISFDEMYRYDALTDDYEVRPNEALHSNVPESAVLEGFALPATDVKGRTIDYTRPTHTGAYQSVAQSKAVDGVLLVTNTNVSGEGSYAQAAYDAFYGEKIVIDPSLKGDTIKLETGFIYARELTIEGNGIVLDGASYSFSSVNYLFSDITFSNFGVFYLGDSRFTAKRCAFKNNTNFAKDGAIDIFNGSVNGKFRGPYTFESCLFSNLYQEYSPSGSSAGAMSLHDVPQGTGVVFNLISCTFADNHDNNVITEARPNKRIASAVSIANTPQVNIFNSVFSNNTSTEGVHTIYGKFNSVGYNVIEGSVSDGSSLSATDTVVTALGNTLAYEDNTYKVSNRGAAYNNVPANPVIEGITLPEKDFAGNTIDYTAPSHSGAFQSFFVAPVPVESVSLNKNTLEIEKGKTELLIATINPEDADNQTLLWSSDNPSVAEVDDNGLVTAVSKGEATITVTTVDDEKTDMCVVTVTDNISVENREVAGGNLYAVNNSIVFEGYDGYTFTLYTIDGKAVAVMDIAGDRYISESRLGKGVYVLRGIGGNVTEEKKIVIK